MNIIDWIKNIFKRSKQKLLDAPKEIQQDKSWKEKLQTPSNQEVVAEKISQEELRIKQIKSVESLVLYRAGSLKGEEIIADIEKTHKSSMISEVDVKTLLFLHDVIELEDEHGDYNIREFIDEEETNYINLIERMIKYAEQKAQENDVEDIIEFVPKNREVINQIKDEMIQESENEIVE